MDDYEDGLVAAHQCSNVHEGAVVICLVVANDNTYDDEYEIVLLDY